MKETILKHKIQLITLSVLLIAISLISLIKVDYKLTAPGYNNNINTFIEIESDYKSSGSFHTTSVIVLNRMTYLQYLVGQVEKKVAVTEIPEYYNHIDIDDLTIMGYQMKDDSLATSLVAAINKTSLSITYETFQTVYLTYDYLDANTLELGDKLITVNGKDPLTGIDEIECDTTGEFTVLRDNQELTFDVTRHQLDNGYCAFGAYIDPLTEIISTEVEYNFVDTNTGGPSGGLLQSLYIFNELTPNDITGGNKIAGTGTIDVDGNVGAIGGIEQKIITSVMNNIDIFFVPYLSDEDSDNYIEAKKVLESLSSDMILVPVQTIDDAITYLETHYGGAFNE